MRLRAHGLRHLLLRPLPPGLEDPGRTVPLGERVLVKGNLPEVLREALRRRDRARRDALRVFFSPATDPYQPVEAGAGESRSLLRAFEASGPVDLLLIQTRSPLLVERDFDIITEVERAVLSVSVQTDDAAMIRRLGGGPAPVRRLETARRAVRVAIPVQITVSPSLPDFVDRLIDTGVRRFVVDTVVDGDGAGGARTARRPYGREPGWDRRDHALSLMEPLRARGAAVGFSAEGFASVPGRRVSAAFPEG